MKLEHIYHSVRKRAKLNNIVLVAAIIIVLSGIWNTVSTLQKNFLLQQKVDLLEQQIKIGQLEVETLRLQQQYLGSNEYLELSARERLNKAAPGERLIHLPPIKSKDHDITKVTPAAQKKVSNAQLWFRFFFGRD